MREVIVWEFPVVQHRHDSGEVVSVKLRRVGGEHRAVCEGCDTEFIYRKPRPSGVVHDRQALLTDVKGNHGSGKSV